MVYVPILLLYAIIMMLIENISIIFKVYEKTKTGKFLRKTSLDELSKYDEEYFKIQGRIFKKMTRKFYGILILQYAIRKYCLYKNDTTFFNAIKFMFSCTFP